MQESIVVRGARAHNLRNVSLTLPQGRLIVFTGVSGSGKSSLAFDTLYAEGQRRYVASLSNYARQFLDQLPRPDVDAVTGIPPALSIDQKSIGRNPRSTVGTLTELYDFLRVVWSRAGEVHCPDCGAAVGAQSREAIVRQAAALQRQGPLLVLAPLVREQRGGHKELLGDLRRRGFLRARIDGEIVRTDQTRALAPGKRHNIDAIVDRLGQESVPDSRVWEAVDTALGLGKGQLILAPEDGPDRSCSTSYACPACGRSCEEPTPAAFSFNTPQGWCPVCLGLGESVEIVEEWLIPDPALSIGEGALAAGGSVFTQTWGRLYAAAARHLNFELHQPWRDLTPAQRRGFLHGVPGRIPMEVGRRTVRVAFEGIVPMLLKKRGDLDADSEGVGRDLARVSRKVRCPACNGGRLRPESLAVTLGSRSIAAAAGLTLGELRAFLQGLPLDQTQRAVVGEALAEADERLRFLSDVGVDYLTCDRSAPTLSGGEAQRIRLAAQVGRGLSGVLYVLDEPSIGLHQRDNRRLISTLAALRDRGSTVVVVEHDEETIRSADLVVDFGPGAGEAGGEVVGLGEPDDLPSCPRSVTGRYLSGEERVPIPQRRREGLPGLQIMRAAANNLREVTVNIPAGVLVAVTGVSGSGKSSLVNDVLLMNLQRHLNGVDEDDEQGGSRTRRQGAVWSDCEGINGTDRFDKVIAIDQSPIGRIPRSNPATYTKLFDRIRELYAQLPEAKVRGYARGRFSFNVAGGRCPVCDGNGARRIDMEFLADAWVECEACRGARFLDETLQVRYRGKSIADVLGMTVDTARSHFTEVPDIRRHLGTLADVGLGYMRLGQPSPTVSGGEAQRIKLARELSRRSTGRTLYVLDEPTTGLHFRDVACLLGVLQRLVDEGNTVVVVEHNLDVIRAADWVIDLGPEGGAMGGRLLAEGTPEMVAACRESLTGGYLREVLGAGRVAGHRRPPRDDVASGGVIEVVGARQNNLRDVHLRLPKERLVALAGPSGAGKTSLALDTVYAEGQRRYVESLSAYARQFLGRAQRPAVDRVDGLCPAIAVDQRAVPPNARSTLGTLTEIYDYLRLLFARAGEAHCPDCGGDVRWVGRDQIAEAGVTAFPGGRVLILGPADAGPDGLAAWCARHARNGYARYWDGAAVHPLDSPPPGGGTAPVDLALVVDRVPAGDVGRLAEAIEGALSAGEGVRRGSVGLVAEGASAVRWWREGFACVACGGALAAQGPHTFAFNDPRGWCPVCEGTGAQRRGQWDSLIPSGGLSLRAGGVGVWGPIGPGPMAVLLAAVGRRHGFTLDTALGAFTQRQREVLLGGDPEPIALDLGGGRPVTARFVGLWAGLELARSQTHSGELSAGIATLFTDADCASCGGSRLGPQGRAVWLKGQTIGPLLRLPLEAARRFFAELVLPDETAGACGQLLREIRGRLHFLCEVGLDYLTLGTASGALSGGEGQRIRLASQLGAHLTGVLYVLDEPTVGLHPRDTERLLRTLRGLRDQGNTVLAVEHDDQLLRAADHVVLFGPGSGTAGGRVVGEGAPAVVLPAAGPAGGGPRTWEPRRTQSEWLVIQGARHHNLRNLDCAIPLGNLVAVTGVSGSGKTSLIIDTLYTALARRLHRAQAVPGPHDAILGAELVDKVIHVNQQPIGDSPRSNAATYTGVFDVLRGLYARVPEARARGLGPNHFSYNHPQGRCDRCEGRGHRRIEMHFLPDVWVLCDACAGRRYRNDVLDILYRGLSIADCLELTVEDACQRFAALKSVRPALETLRAVGLGYLRLGQPAPTLSAGEAQRLKLGRELARPQTGNTLYVLDEPTTGLAGGEVAHLLDLLQSLVDAGNTVVCIEHNLDVMAAADWVIDLGPEGGPAGGQIVAAGPPEAIAASMASLTAPFIARALGLPGSLAALEASG